MTGYALPASLLPARINECYATATPITPTDDTQIGPYMALYVGVGGDVTLMPRNSTVPVLYKGLQAGSTLRVAFQGINDTGTSAADLLGLG